MSARADEKQSYKRGFQWYANNSKQMCVVCHCSICFVIRHQRTVPKLVLHPYRYGRSRFILTIGRKPMSIYRGGYWNFFAGVFSKFFKVQVVSKLQQVLHIRLMLQRQFFYCPKNGFRGECAKEYKFFLQKIHAFNSVERLSFILR